MKTDQQPHEESLHEQKGRPQMPSMQKYIKAKEVYRGFMATHPTDDDKGFSLYYDGMPGGQHRTKEYAAALKKDGYDIEWDNATRIKSKGEQDEKLTTPKETIQGNTQQSRSTTNTMDKGETDRSPDANTGIEEGEVKVEG